MAKVYIINKGCHDYSPAENFGQLVFLSEGTLNRFNTSEMHRRFIHILRLSDPSDFILISGMAIMSSIACSIFATIHHRLNLLLWKSETKTYEERIIVL
jgi:hypothetical protein